MITKEISVLCQGCGHCSRVLVWSVERDNTYCSWCGKRLPLSDVPVVPGNTGLPMKGARSQRRHRITKRR